MTENCARQAYYCCIAQLLSSWSSRKTATFGGLSDGEGKEAGGGGSEEEKGAPAVNEEGSAAKEMVYVCGDSHTLTPAWHEVTVGGR